MEDRTVVAIRTPLSLDIGPVFPSLTKIQENLIYVYSGLFHLFQSV